MAGFLQKLKHLNFNSFINVYIFVPYSGHLYLLAIGSHHDLSFKLYYVLEYGLKTHSLFTYVKERSFSADSEKTLF